MEDFQIIDLFHQRNPDATRETGVMWDEERTEDGVCIYGSPLVPKPYRDHFTITLRVKSLD